MKMHTDNVDAALVANLAIKYPISVPRAFAIGVVESKGRRNDDAVNRRTSECGRSRRCV